MSATEFPAFLWEDNGMKYDEEDMYSGLFRGFYLERVARHIFTGPSTAHGGDSHAVCLCNAILHRMDKVEAAHIAYAAVLACFGISSQSRWSEKDGRFNYRKFYYIIQDVINKCEVIKWKEALLKHYNMLFFRNEDGRASDFTAMDNESTLSPKSGSGGFLSHMRVQAAACAADIVRPPPALPDNHTPPPTSLGLATDLMGVTTMAHEPSPEPSVERPSSTFIPVQACDDFPTTITPQTDCTPLDAVSDLSEIEPEGVPEVPGKSKKKPSAAKGKRKATVSQSSEGPGGPSKRRSSRKKAGNNA